MKTKTTLWVSLSVNAMVLVLIYLPFVFQSLKGYAILAPAFLNLAVLAGELVICLIVTLIPKTRPYAGACWLGWGLLLLSSFPACLATSWLSQQLTH